MNAEGAANHCIGASHPTIPEPKRVGLLLWLDKDEACQVMPRGKGDQQHMRWLRDAIRQRHRDLQAQGQSNVNARRKDVG
eukprot:13856930-Alexandrium_andersonii.AAC.1